MTRVRRTVGRLLAALRLMSHLRKVNDTKTLAKLEKCFAADWSYVRKTKELDKLLQDNKHVLV